MSEKFWREQDRYDISRELLRLMGYPEDVVEAASSVPADRLEAAYAAAAESAKRALLAGGAGDVKSWVAEAASERAIRTFLSHLGPSA